MWVLPRQQGCPPLLAPLSWPSQHPGRQILGQQGRVPCSSGGEGSEGRFEAEHETSSDQSKSKSQHIRRSIISADTNNTYMCLMDGPELTLRPNDTGGAGGGDFTSYASIAAHVQ